VAQSVDPDRDTDHDPSFQVNPDPDTVADPDPIRIQGFDDQKLKKINTALFGSNIAVYLCRDLSRQFFPSDHDDF
jgi:hypothetical protein